MAGRGSHRLPRGRARDLGLARTTACYATSGALRSRHLNKCSQIENLGRAFPIVLLDLGGRRTAENAEILKRSTHLLVLSSKEDENKPWQEFAATEGCETLAILASRIVKTMDGNLDQTVLSSLDVSGEIVHGELLNLDREAGSAPFSSAVSQFADWLIAKAGI